MHLTKTIPTRKKTLVALWCNKQFGRMSPTFRAIRAQSRNPMNACFWCGHNFDDGEMMALAAFEGKGNKMLCQVCAQELLASEQAEEAIAKAERS